MNKEYFYFSFSIKDTDEDHIVSRIQIFLTTVISTCASAATVVIVAAESDVVVKSSVRGPERRPQRQSGGQNVSKCVFDWTARWFVQPSHSYSH